MSRKRDYSKVNDNDSSSEPTPKRQRLNNDLQNNQQSAENGAICDVAREDKSSSSSHNSHALSDNGNSNNAHPPKAQSLSPTPPPAATASPQIQDIDSWVAENNLGQFILTKLKQYPVHSTNDFSFLKADDIEEFTQELGLKIIQRKKLAEALKSLNCIQKKPSQQTKTIDPQMDAKEEVDLKYSKQKPNLPMEVVETAEQKKRRERKKQTAHLQGDVLVQFSLKQGGLDAQKKNRCILVIGATGTGKTTCLNSMMNYLWEVEFDDKFRYKLIMESRNANQAESQTKDVTAYYLNPPRLDYTVTLIDTPGYGDTVGMTQDDKITQKIKHTFDKKIQSIDAVCFVIRAPQARLEATQRYVFNKVLEVFGKDIKDNIFILLTFADGQRPPALAAIKEANIPYKKAFKLNNSGFFLNNDVGNDDFDNDGLDDDDFGKNYWDMGMRAFGKFFKELDTVQSKSLQLTKQVLSRREQLQDYIVAIQPSIDKAYSILDRMRTTINEVNKHAAIVDSSKDFHIMVDVNKTRQVPVTDGRNTTTCTNCVGHYTCHKNCSRSDNADKKKCCMMDRETGNCKVCPGKCNWITHKNLPYIVEFYTVKEKRTVDDLKKKYYDAKNKQSASDQIIAGLTSDLEKEEGKLAKLIDDVRRCINELRQMALQPNLMNKDDYIDQLIESEKAKRNPGWQSRVKSLKELKAKDKILFAINDNKFNNQFGIGKYKDVGKYLAVNNHRRNHNHSKPSSNQSNQRKGFLGGLFKKW